MREEKCNSFIIININQNRGDLYMLVENQIIPMVWCGKNRKHYTSLGYKYTKYKDVFYVKAEDLSPHSLVKVKVSCDYCGKIYEKTFHAHKEHGDVCVDCYPKKRNENNIKKYGVPNPFQRPDVNEKKRQTMLSKYGVENPQQVQEIYEKTHKTVQEKYGTYNLFQSEEIKAKTKQTNLYKYGYEYISQVPEIREKVYKSFVKDGKWISKPEQEMCDILKNIYGTENCIQQYFTGYYYLDCLLVVKDVKIDVEYDAIYFHNRQEKHDIKRDKYHIATGYKVLRFKDGKKVPTIEQITSAVDELINTDIKYKEILL